MSQPPVSFSQKWTAFFSRKAPNLVLRVVVLVLGFSFIAFGVALSRSTFMGTSPISAIPNVLSYVITQFTLGQIAFVFNILLVLFQIALLRRDFKPVQLLQIAIVIPFSALIDLFVPITELIPQPNYAANFALLLVAALFTAFGVFLEVKSCVVPLPGEGASVAVSQAFKLPFHKCKLGFDVSNIVIGAVISLAAHGMLIGVREGSIITALLTGNIVKVFNKLLPNFEAFCPTEGMFEFGSKSND